MSGFAFHPEAFTDIDEIAIYIGQDSPDAALRVVDELYDAIATLAPFPHQGHRRPDLTRRAMRFQRVRDYLIAYAPEESPLWVVPRFHVLFHAAWPLQERRG